jgi:ABC-type branched-subunit amino acid transport system substrate-binding protein
MKKIVTLVLALAIVACLAFGLVACNKPATPDNTPDGPTGTGDAYIDGLNELTQGVDTTNHTIKVGNTAATSGAFAAVGVPFNYAQEAYFWYFENHTEGYKDADGNKYSIEFITYDDGFVAANGVTYTEKLVEDDQVFALVGHFGSGTVAATMEYVEEMGIPMVYGVCGVSQLYNTERNAMTVQPIYDTEGQSMVATAFAPVAAGGLGATRLGVISTTDDAGIGMLNGIQIEVQKLGKGSAVVYQTAGANDTDYATQVTALKTAGCDVVIIAANQAPFINIANTFVTANYDNVKIMTSYVSANAAAMGGLVTSGAITETREIYAGAWLVTGSVPTETKGWTDFVEYVKVMTLYAKSQGETLIPATDPIYGALIAYYFAGMDWAADGVSSYWLNSYGMAGYVSANVFCQGLSRMSGKDLRWGDYVLAMEEGLVNVPMGTAVDYREGKRVGIDSLAVNRYTVANAAAGGEVYRAITDLATLEAAING